VRKLVFDEAVKAIAMFEADALNSAGGTPATRQETKHQMLGNHAGAELRSTQPILAAANAVIDLHPNVSRKTCGRTAPRRSVHTSIT
jgi:hypothetical protein